MSGDTRPPDEARARAQPLPQLAPGSRVAGYEVLERLGAGGYGTVYRVRCEGHISALKLLPLESSGGWEEREVDVMRRLKHPNVACLRGYFDWPAGEPRFRVLLMDYVEGDPLDVHARRQDLSALEVVKLLLPLADALDTIHQAGVVHRDVKESNILVRASDRQPVLVDFGAGHYEGAPTLTTLSPPGTFAYRGPEAWELFRPHPQGQPRYRLGPPDDLWATGVVLYWLLTDRRPFMGRDMLDVGRAILNESAVPPHVHNPRVPQALGRLCQRLLERTRETRLLSARALRAELEVLAEGEDASWRAPLFESGARRPPPPRVAQPPPPQVEEPPAQEEEKPPVLLQQVPPPSREEKPREEEKKVERTRPGWARWAPVLGAVLLLSGALGTWLLVAGKAQQSSAVESAFPPVTSPHLNPIQWGTFFRELALTPKRLEFGGDEARNGAQAQALVINSNQSEMDMLLKLPRMTLTPGPGQTLLDQFCRYLLLVMTVVFAGCATSGATRPTFGDNQIVVDKCTREHIESMRNLGIPIGTLIDATIDYINPEEELSVVSPGGFNSIVLVPRRIGDLSRPQSARYGFGSTLIWAEKPIDGRIYGRGTALLHGFDQYEQESIDLWCVEAWHQGKPGIPAVRWEEGYPFIPSAIQIKVVDKFTE